MQKFFSRLFPAGEAPEPLTPGIYHGMFPEGIESPNRLHLRIEQNGTGLLLLNAATVLHLNASATEHVYHWIKGKSEEEAAQAIAQRYRVSQATATKNQKQIREQIHALVEAPDLDPVLFIGLDRTDPYATVPPAPYRLDCALTYKADASGSHDPLARARVDKELTPHQWMEILRKAWEFGIPHVTFTGGEPCLWDELPELIAHCEKLGQITGLLTNGERLSESAYLSSLDQAGLDHLMITYAPAKAASLTGIDAAIATDIFTAVHLLVEGPQSLAHLDQLAEHGVTAVSLATSGEHPEALEQARDHAAGLGMDLVWDLPVPYSSQNPITLELEGKFAGDGRGWLYVEPDGDVLPAQGIDMILGNIMREPWQAIWDNAVAWRSG